MKLLGTNFHARSIAAANAEIQKMRAAFALYQAGYRYSTDRTYIEGTVQDPKDDCSEMTRTELVRKSHHFEHNDALAQRLAEVFVEFTVGANGLTISPESSDDDWNQRADDWLEEWSPLAEYQTRLGYGNLMTTAAWRRFFDGEFFILKTYGETKSRPRLQGISAHRVGTPPEMADKEGKTIIDGVQLGERGRPSGYWIQEGVEADKYTLRSSNEIIHIFEPESPGQYRGVPMLASVLNDLHDFRDLFDFEKNAAKVQGKDAAFWKNASGTVPGSSTFGLPSSSLPGDVTDPSAETAARQKLIQNVFGVRTLAGKLGEEVEYLASNRPSVTTQWFFDYLAWRVCIGVGISKMLILPQSIQGTVARLDLDLATNYFRSRFSAFSSAAHQIFMFVIGTARFSDPRIADAPANWTRVEILPPRAPNVDVGRNSAAMIAELESGATTLKDIYLPQGKSWRKQLRQRAKEESYIDQLATEFKISAGRIRRVIGESQKIQMAVESQGQTQQDNAFDVHIARQLQLQ